MKPETPAALERRQRVGKTLLVLGTLCLAASIALLIVAQMILHRGGR